MAKELNANGRAMMPNASRHGVEQGIAEADGCRAARRSGQ